MDGELQILQRDPDDEEDDYFRAIKESMDNEIRGIVEKMMTTSSSLATWDFKSMATGPEDVVMAVRNLGKFSWTTCRNEGCHTQVRSTGSISALLWTHS
jgi:hypothetical protein